MRDYLLGKLDDQAAEKLERRYFTDAAFFRQVRAAETELIEDYLRGRLRWPDRRRMERRYLRVAKMRERLEEVRSDLRLPLPAEVPALVWMRPLLAGLAVLGIASALWLLGIKQNPAPPVAKAPAATSAPPIELAMVLSPGLQKGKSSSNAQVVLPKSSGYLTVKLELPGKQTPVPVGVEILRSAAGEQLVSVWTSSEPILSLPSGEGQTVQFRINIGTLVPAEYLVRISSADKRVSETYVFRAIAPE